MNNIDDMYDYLTKNRKLKLEEYDDCGELIDVIEFSKNELWEFLILRNSPMCDISTSKKKDREYFKGEELEIAYLIMRDIYTNCLFDENSIKLIENILNKYNINEIRLAIDLSNSYRVSIPSLSLQENSKLRAQTKDFDSALKWIKRTDGIYFAVNNNGEKCWTYLTKPTQKQAKYQRQKHGRRIVFWNFRDWKEYDLTEEELI